MLKNRSSILIIAEAGVNHNGNIDKAIAMVDAAADAGADIVKFQTFSTKAIVTLNAIKADYQLVEEGESESQYELLSKLQLSQGSHKKLLEYARSIDIEFLSTAFDLESVEFLASLDLCCFKIPSGEITHLPYLRLIGRQKKPVILSTGMSRLDEIETALGILEGEGLNRKDITILHCNSEYPTPICDVNLRAMVTLRDTFGTAVGYSDHTLGIEVPIAATALGATVIEKHYTLDRNMEGPDHKASLTPSELKEMVEAIRITEEALGSPIKEPTGSERKNLDPVRKSIVASTVIRKGESFSESNLTCKRPGAGISPMRWDEIVGQTAHCDYEPDDQITI